MERAPGVTPARVQVVAGFQTHGADDGKKLFPFDIALEVGLGADDFAAVARQDIDFESGTFTITGVETGNAPGGA